MQAESTFWGTALQHEDTTMRISFGRRKRISRRTCLRAASLLPAAGLNAAAGVTREGNIHTIGDLDTPAMVIDLDVLEKNIREMQQVCREADIGLQVHIKTHKIPEIAHMQLRAGAVGICCQKLGEAEVMVAGRGSMGTS